MRFVNLADLSAPILRCYVGTHLAVLPTTVRVLWLQE